MMDVEVDELRPSDLFAADFGEFGVGQGDFFVAGTDREHSDNGSFATFVSVHKVAGLEETDRCHFIVEKELMFRIDVSNC
jgi:hypothetical protein